MGNYLSYIRLPISKVIAKGIVDYTKARQTFEFDKWLNAPAITKILNERPDIKNELENEFKRLFKNPKLLNLNEFTLYGFDIKMRLDIRLDINLFYKMHLVSCKDYATVYMLAVEPKLAAQLPTNLNGIEIVGGDLLSPTVVTLQTLLDTDLDEFRASIDTSKDKSLKDREWVLDEIIEGLKEAKKRECDFFTWVG